MADPSYSDRLHRVIPGGAHTYSRGDDQYPSNAPQILVSGNGAYVRDPDGREFLDYGMGLRSVTLGYAHEKVNAGAIAAIMQGNNLTRPSLLELEAAEAIVDLFPWADMVKFAKNGSTVTTAAVKLARAHTGRTHVAVCAEHPFFTFDDWFIGTTPMDRGIPAQHASLTLKFHYNDIASLQRLFDEHPGQIACVMLEPATSTSPCPASGADMGTPEHCADHLHQEPNFLQQVRELCTRNGALLVLDEMITGFRWDLRGAMHVYDVVPDLATFGKGMANGFALAALVGKREIMELGGIRRSGAERTFLISTTHGSEMSALGAFMATVAEYKERSVTDGFWAYGSALAQGMNAIAREEGVSDHFEVAGLGCSPLYLTRNAQGEADLGFRTLFSQGMVEQGVLMAYIAISAAHGPTELDRTLTATRHALRAYASALTDGLDKFLKGPSIRPVFRKYN